ncbi:MAG: DNA polymerase III subunit alpha [Gemmatimonas sp.]|jgi:error-prone DNA polymerase|uniref:DNA polymerase III subunit alpha n=2 Tax=Gemmatimonas sp. TaxID=1962908 RepID=UPI0025B8A74D|nr:PHP domain-containing protein [Gemmatimonas sp.]MCA2984960.1 PHP domain-containing protein [Gemmatimonas sp.]
MMASPAYAELHCHSALSLLDGASLPETLAERAAALGYRALALTDHDEMGGVVRFGTACAALALPGILGAELTVRMPELAGRGGERRTHLVLLAESHTGYHNIATLVTRARMDSERGRPSVPWALVTRHVEGVTALTGCPRGWLPQLLAEGRADLAWTAACELRDVFGTQLAIECWDHRLPEERALVGQLRPLAARLGVPWVVTNNVHYADPAARIVHDVLHTLRHERTLDTMGTRLKPNAEWALKPVARIYRRWRGAEEGVRATVDIAERCAFRLEQLKPSLPAFPLPPGVTANEYLARLVEQGAHERWGNNRTPTHDRQLAHELGMIRKLELAGFFLIVWDIVRFARREGILCQGRGSAANSAVCFCLGITAVDPIRMELLFERFLSEERQEPPDIDIDFAHRDRERVLQYVYNRYGREHAAMVCEQITWRGRSAVRDAARVLGFSTEQADMLAALSDRFSARSTAEALRVDEVGNGAGVEGGAEVGGKRDHTERTEAVEGTGNANSSDAARHGQHMIRGTEATTKARVVRERARTVAATRTSSSVPSTASVSAAGTRFSPTQSTTQPPPPKSITERDATWQQLMDLRAEQKLASDEHAQLGPLAKGAERETHAEFVEGRNRTTATREGPSGRALLQRAGLDPDDPRVRQLAHVVHGLHALPRHRSIHVGGFILTEEPLGGVVPLEPASMPGRTVIQWEKDDLDPVGLVKIDLLGLGMLTVVQDCLLYIRHTRGVTVDLGQLDMSDAAVYDVMCRADTVGLFQIESRAQMNTLPRLKPRCFYDLVVEVALIRPGPIQGEMVHPYLRRRAGLEPITYPHPSVEHVLRRTLGVPLFQEQGMQVAIAAAGFTPGQADVLRRAMGHKRSRERMAAICEELIAGMQRNGIPEETARRIYNQINAFADYGFPESHAASFALIVYATAWLRHYYAPEYLCAILNAQPMGFYSPGTLIEDARRHGVRVLPLDLTKSVWDHSLELSDGRVLYAHDGTVRWGALTTNNCNSELQTPPPPRDVAVRLGLRLVRGLGARARRSLEAALRDGPFTSVEDAVQRVPLDRAAWRHLAEAGAFDTLFAHEPPERRRRAALWEVMAVSRRPELPLAPRATPTTARRAPLPAYTPVELTEADFRMTGLSLTGHPMVHVRAHLALNGVRTARDAHESGKDGQPVAVAGLVICRQRPGTAKGFVFLTLEDETGMINIVITPDRFEQHALLISTTPLLLVRGTLQVEQQVVNVRAKQVRALELGGGEQHVKGHNYR